MIDFTEIANDGERWEAFARDFLFEAGFSIESPPARGADGGKDMLVVEPLSGPLGSYAMRWLVSCKHFAISGKSVGLADEPDISDRLKRFQADGFLGVYSTVASSALNDKLAALRSTRDIRDYRLFDGRLIENYCLKVGYSRLLMRYFPDSHRQVAPLHTLTDAYIPLPCERCGKDLLLELFANEQPAVVAHVHEDQEDGTDRIVDVYWACKGACDHALERRAQSRGRSTGWEDIGDLVIPAWFVRHTLSLMNRLERRDDVWTPEAFEKKKRFLIAVAQKVVREMTEREHQRVSGLLGLPEGL